MRTRKTIASLRPFSAVVLGTDHMGGSVPASEAVKIAEFYLQSGGNVIDTARSYHSEALVASVLAKTLPSTRPIVMTKGGREIDPPETFLERAKADFARSCSELGFLPDIWFLHRDCLPIPVDEIVGFCQDFLGPCLLGLSNWTPPRFGKALALERPPVVSEIQFSLAPSTPDLHGDPSLVCMDSQNAMFYKKTQVPVMAFSSQAKGYFSKVLSSTPLSPKARSRFDSPAARERAGRVEVLSRRLGVPPAAIAVAFLCSYPLFPVLPIVGASSLPQLKESILGGSIQLSSSDIRFLVGEGEVF